MLTGFKSILSAIPFPLLVLNIISKSVSCYLAHILDVFSSILTTFYIKLLNKPDFSQKKGPSN